MKTVAQIGCGYWGPNLLRNLDALRDCRVKYVAEASAERRAFVTQNYPAVETVDSACTVLGDPEVDAVVIATPASTHAPLALDAIAAGKHVFVEKPLAMSVAEAEMLGRAAADRGVVLMAGHTFLYNAAVTYLRNLVSSGALGDIYYIYAQRLNLGVVRNDVDALWNLAPHDVSIINYILGQAPEQVQATGTDYLQPGIADVVFMQLQYPGRVRASIQVSWLDPNKVRRMTVVGSRKMVVYDDVADDKIAIYDKGIDSYVPAMAFDKGTPLKYRNGEVVLPRIEFVEPIRVQLQHFLRCVATGETPLSGAANGRDVVAVLEAASSSMLAGGAAVPVAAASEVPVRSHAAEAVRQTAVVR
jgi:predicted dehydrogenase